MSVVHFVFHFQGIYSFNYTPNDSVCVHTCTTVLHCMSSLYRVCTINGTVLEMRFDCDSLSNASTRVDVCHPDNPDIQRLFNGSYYVDEDWIEFHSPTCLNGIPGITASRLIVGKHIHTYIHTYIHTVSIIVFSLTHNIFV